VGPPGGTEEQASREYFGVSGLNLSPL
jgi:hypothetical protein